MNPESLLTSGAFWPLALGLAWALGEALWRAVKIPKISTYAFSGLVSQMLFPSLESMTISSVPTLIANVGFGLILFECGYRINVRWLLKNHWILVGGIIEAIITFLVVFLLAGLYMESLTHCTLIASLTMATSPAVLLRVINDERSSGQVTERAIHLAAITTLLSVFFFKISLGAVIFNKTGYLWEAAAGSIVLFMTSAVFGACFGMVLGALPSILKRGHLDLTVAYALSVMCCVVLLDTMSYSPVVGALTFGLVSRYRRQAPGVMQRGFGSLGELCSIFLFFYLAMVLDTADILQGFWLAILILLLRQTIKTLVMLLFARVSGISKKKSVLVGLASAPLSVFVLLSLENTSRYGMDIMENVLPLATACVIMEVVAPFLVRLSLTMARETSRQEDG